MLRKLRYYDETNTEGNQIADLHLIATDLLKRWYEQIPEHPYVRIEEAWTSEHTVFNNEV